MKTITNPIIQFELPPQLATPLPTERRNLQRDEVRLLITTGSGQTYHDTFRNLDQYLRAGDVLVLNTSATVASALQIRFPDGRPGMIHLSTHLGEQEWLIEVREIQDDKTIRWKEGEEGMIFPLAEGGSMSLKRRFYKDQQMLDLWIAELQIPMDLTDYLERHGQPIKYAQLSKSYPISYYQTAFAFRKGSTEMPSAGRGFTTALLRRLVRKGVILAPILLHTGVSSLEEHETPYPEYMEIDPISALLINEAKADGRRVIAVGTTAIRALESAVNAWGEVEAFRGHTDFFIHESHQMKVADGLLTGFHEPHASHLNMLQSLAGFSHIEQAYQEAIEARYLWHEFGDLHLYFVLNALSIKGIRCKFPMSVLRKPVYPRFANSIWKG